MSKGLLPVSKVYTSFDVLVSFSPSFRFTQILCRSSTHIDFLFHTIPSLILPGSYGPVPHIWNGISVIPRYLSNTRPITLRVWTRNLWVVPCTHLSQTCFLCDFNRSCYSRSTLKIFVRFTGTKWTLITPELYPVTHVFTFLYCLPFTTDPLDGPICVRSGLPGIIHSSNTVNTVTLELKIFDLSTNTV